MLMKCHFCLVLGEKLLMGIGGGLIDTLLVIKKKQSP